MRECDAPILRVAEREVVATRVKGFTSAPDPSGTIHPMAMGAVTLTPVVEKAMVGMPWK